MTVLFFPIFFHSEVYIRLDSLKGQICILVLNIQIQEFGVYSGLPFKLGRIQPRGSKMFIEMLVKAIRKILSDKFAVDLISR